MEEVVGWYEINFIEQQEPLLDTAVFVPNRKYFGNPNDWAHIDTLKKIKDLQDADGISLLDEGDQYLSQLD